MLCGFGIFVNHAKDFVMLYLATFCNLFFFFPLVAVIFCLMNNVNSFWAIVGCITNICS
jgi:hypothetical protein